MTKSKSSSKTASRKGKIKSKGGKFCALPFHEKKLVSMKEAQAYLHLNDEEVKALLRDGSIKGARFKNPSKVGNGKGKWLFERISLERWADRFISEAA